MTERRALFIQGDGSDPEHTAEETRLLMAATFGGQTYDAVAPGIGAIARGHGVIGAGSLAVTPNGTPNDTVHVAAGAFAVRGTQENDQNVYVAGNDGQVTLNISASPTNPRRDLVIAQIRDDQYATHTGDDWVITTVTGTPAGSPSDPAVPEDALVLARLRVPTGVSAVISAAEIDDLRPRVVATGGITPVNALADLPGPAHGDVVYRRDVDRLAVRTGSAWRHIAPLYVATGVTTVVFSNQLTASSGTINYGLTFAAAPTVTCTARRSDARFGVSLLDPPTPTGFNAAVWTSLGGNFSGNVSLEWQAIGSVAA